MQGCDIKTLTMELFPLKGVGPFLFSTPFSRYAKYPFVKDNIKYDEVLGNLVTYTLAGRDIGLSVVDGVVDGVTCGDECILDGRNLIGLEEGVAMSVIPCEFTGSEILEMDWGEITLLEFEVCGIHVYVEDGFVTKVDCFNYDGCED